MDQSPKKKLRATALTAETKSHLLELIDRYQRAKELKLPSEEELAEIVGVSRITIRGALNELQSEGLIFRKHGKGTFINPEALKIKVQLSPVSLFKDMIISSGFTPSVKIIHLSLTEASLAVADALSLSPGDSLYITKKIFYANNHPCAYCIDYFSSDFSTKPLTIADLTAEEDSIFQYFSVHHQLHIAWDKTEIQTITNLEMPELSTAFDLDRQKIASYLLLKSVNYTEDNRPIIFAEEYIDTSFINFSMIRQKKILY